MRILNIKLLWAIFMIAFSFSGTFGQCTVSTTFLNVTCNGGNDGSISVVPTGGVSPYTITWTNGLFGFNPQGVAAGCYQGTITDAIGCTFPFTVCITQPSPLLVSIAQNGNNLIATASGGTPPYTYMWSNGSTTSMIQTGSPGVYTVTVVDANGCSSSQSYTWNPNPVNTILNGQVSIDCNQDGTIDSVLNNVPLQLYQSGNYFYDTLQNSSSNFGLYISTYYTIEIVNSWLSQNGYIVANISPSTQQMVPGNTYNFTASLVCDTNATNLNLNGTVFCDANSNGIQDSGENSLQGVPITATMNGSSIQTYTSVSGAYSLTLFGNPSDSMNVTISPSYLQFNGNTTNTNYQQYVNGWNTSNSSTLNIGLNCLNGSNMPLNYTGFTFCDANSNGTFDSGENPLANAPVILYSGTNNVMIYSDSTGQFSFTGSFTNSTSAYAIISQTYLSNNGLNSVAAQAISGSTSTPTPIYFAVNCNPCTNLSTYVSHGGAYYQGTTVTINLSWQNQGPAPCGSYTLKLKHPNNCTPIYSSIANQNYTISGDTIIWQITGGSSYNYDGIQFLLPTGVTTNMTQYYESFILPTCGIQDCQMSNNQYLLTRVLGNSYDPNNKLVSRPQNTEILFSGLDENLIDANSTETLTYTINFQNTGSAPAQNIYIIDTIDADLDIASLDIFEFSHTLNVIPLGNNIIRFDFPQIWLVDSTTNEVESHGYLRYRINEIPSPIFPEFDTITNTAYIFFDWNDAIITNTALNINSTLWQVLEKDPLAFTLIPNPGNNYVNIQAAGPFSYKLNSIDGKTELEGKGIDFANVDTKSLENGTYLIKVWNNDQSTSRKWIKIN